MQLVVDALTSGTSCDSAVLTALMDKVKALSVTPAFSGSKEGVCRLVDGVAEYSGLVGTEGFTDDQIETAADAVTLAVEGSTLGSNSTNSTRRLLAPRRLESVSVSTSYAAQDTEACAADDSTCGQTDSSLTRTGTSSSSTGGSSTSSTG